jgi:hypothetical protein
VQGITLIPGVDPLQITPDPTEAERDAILAALAAEEAQRPAVSAWADALLPPRGGEDGEP